MSDPATETPYKEETLIGGFCRRSINDPPTRKDIER